ncbi:arylformamidase [Salimicrobium jeotgali]|uniref:Kynurenine formamidase n=1 Tax=Salimicrobium jeotgali TaxID=1230341 RepID=K2FKJ3_9BACI|nr:arylformamidase [Salimicrobium jeotgali]AKG04877.1 arylformamidase [Salimicrobium jeotgali]EKE31541.1 cyclase family protein [Salimicrobium jeotgali]MBM7696359.1 arylformamidase [Salimicrobium jeotgali]
MGWIDISRPLNDRISTWPEDTPYSYRRTATKKESGSVNIGEITMSVHTGTHIDAPFHFDNEGKRVNELDINVYIGRTKVVDCRGFEAIGAAAFEGIDLENVERVLIKTDAFPDSRIFPEEIPYLKPEVAEFFKEKNIRLVGVDVPSVDPMDSETLDAHHALFSSGVHILENADLREVESGLYDLSALPLALEEADGSPVRAVLKSVYD